MIVNAVTTLETLGRDRFGRELALSHVRDYLDPNAEHYSEVMDEVLSDERKFNAFMSCIPCTTGELFELFCCSLMRFVDVTEERR